MYFSKKLIYNSAKKRKYDYFYKAHTKPAIYTCIKP